jgi:hypothetical protein
MKKTRLSAAFCRLDAIERNRFYKYLASTFFNQREDIRKLFRLLEQVPMPQEEAFTRLFPEEKSYDPQKLYNLMSLGMRHLEQFWRVQSALENEVAGKLMAADAMQAHQLEKHFHKALNDTEKLLFKSSRRNAEYYDRQVQLLERRSQSASRQSRQGDHYLQELSDTLDVAFIIKKLRAACLAHAHQTVNQQPHRIGLLPAILTEVENQSYYDSVPAIGIYYFCFKALNESKEEVFFKQFKDRLFTHRRKFDQTELRDLFLLAVNYCIQQLNKNNRSYYPIGLELYKMGLKEEYLLQNGQISRYSYYNCLAMALQSGEFEWARNFLYEYKDRINDKHRESAFSFGLTRLEYEEGNYDEALLLLQKADYRDLLLSLMAKTLQLKIYFETEEWDLLYAHLDAMQSFLNRKKVMGYHKTNFRNIVLYTRRILRLRPSDKVSRSQLCRDIEAEEILTEREWLLKQLGEGRPQQSG